MNLAGFSIQVRSTLPDEPAHVREQVVMAHSLELRVPLSQRGQRPICRKIAGACESSSRSQNGFIASRQSYIPVLSLTRKKRGFTGNVVDDWFRGAMDSKMAGGSWIVNRRSRYLNPHAVQKYLQTIRPFAAIP